MGSFLQDLRYGIRTLLKSPGFTVVAVLTLALGIGANTAIFSVIEAVLLRPLPYKDPAQLVVLTDARDSDLEGGDGGILYKDFIALRSENHAFAELAVYYRNSGWSRVTLTGSEPQSAQGVFVSANFFPTVGIAPLLGRWFTPEEETRRERVVVLSYGLWTRRFGASSDVLGKTLAIDEASWRVIGVMPPSFQLPAKDAQFWAPLTTNLHWVDANLAKTDPQRMRGFYVRWKAIGRLKSGISVVQAQAEIATINNRLRLSDADVNRGEMAALPLRTRVTGNTRLVLYVLSGAVFLVLLIACINVANLVLARGTAREREFALRAALGAGRRRLLRQLFTESALLVVPAAALGIGIAAAGVRTLIAVAPPSLPRLNEAVIDSRVLAFTVAASILASVLFGLIPAWKISLANPNESLKAGGKGMSGSAAMRKTHSVLVTAEFALSVVLLVGAGLLIRTIVTIEAVDPGFRPDHVLTMTVATPWGTPPQQARAVLESSLERISALPEVRAAGGTKSLFDFGQPFLLGLRAIEGRIPEPKERRFPLVWDTVSGDYFGAMGIPLFQGRFFSSSDGPQSPLVAVIDEDAARRYWPGKSPIGQRIKGQDKRGLNDDWVTIVGVVGNVRSHGLDKVPTGHIYEWSVQSGDETPNIIVRTAIEPSAFGSRLRNAIRDVNQNLIISNVTTMDQQLSEQLSPRRFQTWLLGLFSFLALALACVGIYAVMQYSVTQRTPEIGVRLALGATGGDVVTMIVKHGLTLASAGIAFGLVGALMVTHLLSNLLYEVHPIDPLTFTAVILLLVMTAFAACYIPARRAAKVDPMVALRYE